MDIRCRHCGEPVDTDEFHVDERYTPGNWQQWITMFKKHGCTVLDHMTTGGTPHEVIEDCSAESVVGEEQLEGIEVLQEMLGDDIDGLAAMTEDFMLRD